MNISKQLIIRELDDQVVIINLNNGNVTVLDEIGKLFWNSLVNNIEKCDFIENMKNEFDVSYETLERDYDIFVKKIKEAEIVW